MRQLFSYVTHLKSSNNYMLINKNGEKTKSDTIWNTSRWKPLFDSCIMYMGVLFFSPLTLSLFLRKNMKKEYSIHYA